ncbi:Guanylate-binding protein N-terminal domain family protein [Babesia bovis T2Bo]|uniref:Guanylate-binding protein N-terminal domain-containing protein n=1 Tax=Babesia bovis TaxID=5865 RepID=A7AUA1_BABBO|nr:Guanylate-binding protein N-terminal domain family protein [Babesia bovis T2Bo]EDO06512.1 Guanylate-binding protein N-terminal domain family protein [Babesia bovis T2Bo]|eukprot:XP_001610080.1 hypothetical protein [Babesia bovis T2Bo]
MVVVIAKSPSCRFGRVHTLIKALLFLITFFCVTFKHTESLVSTISTKGFASFDEVHADVNPQNDANELAEYCIAGARSSGQPVQLVRPLTNRLGIELVPEGLQLLASLQKPIAVVSAVGNIKTGKSSLLNVLNENTFCANGEHINGFATNDRVEPLTRGIWIWSAPVEVDCSLVQQLSDKKYSQTGVFDHLVVKITSLFEGQLKASLVDKVNINASDCLYKKINVVFMDIEGFNATDGFQKYDEALFTIAAALSTELIYLNHRIIDAADIIQLQRMLQSASHTLVNMYKSLSNVPSVKMQLGKDGKGYSGIDIVKQGEKATEIFTEEPNTNANQISDAESLNFSDMLLELQKSANLTLAVQGFDFKLNYTALDYVNSVVNQKRYDISYGDQKSFYDYLEQTRTSFVKLIQQDGNADPDQVVADILTKLTSKYKYSIPHLFGSVDALLTSRPCAYYGGCKKGDLHKEYLDSIKNYKMRLYKRSVSCPKKRISTVQQSLTLMTGEDLGHVLAHLIKILNYSMQHDVEISGEDSKITRARLVVHDLVELYSADLLGFINKTPIPLEKEFEIFNGVISPKYSHLLAINLQYDLNPMMYQQLKGDYDKRVHGIYSHLLQQLHRITMDYCSSKVAHVRNVIRMRIEGFKLPVLPKVIEEFESSKQKLLEIYTSAIDEAGIKYSDSEACKQVYIDMNEFINSQIDDLKTENDNEINMKFQEAARHAIGCFIADADRNDLDKYKVTYEKYESSLQSWIKTVDDVFKSEIGDFSSIKRFNDPTVAFLQQQMALLVKESRDHWNDVCKDSIEHITQKFKRTFDGKLQKLLPVRPAPTQLMSLGVEYIRYMGLKEINGLYCGSHKTAKKLHEKFNQMIDAMKQRVLEENDESILKHFHKEFKLMQEEAMERVNNVYHYYQLESHLYWYVRKHIFPQSKSLIQLLRPEKALDEMKKIMDMNIVNSVTDEKIHQQMKNIMLKDSSKALHALKLDSDMLLTAVVGNWLKTQLYPNIRDKLMIRLPKMTTFFAMIVCIICTMLLFKAKNIRTFYYLCFCNAAALLYILGMRNFLLVIGTALQWIAAIVINIMKYIGTAWFIAITGIIMSVSFIWKYYRRRSEESRRSRRTKYLLLKRSR